MKAVVSFLFFTLLSSNLLFGESPGQKKNRIGTHIHVLLGGHVSAFYERRLNDIFAIEGGAVGGENFIAYGFSRMHHVGPFLATNLYLTNVDAYHHICFSPSVAITYGEASISSPKDENREKLNAIALNGSAYFVYRYLFSFGLGIETGLGVDAVSILFPLKPNNSVKMFSFPVPKIELGLSYAF